jgi:hypothetical protein
MKKRMLRKCHTERSVLGPPGSQTDRTAIKGKRNRGDLLLLFFIAIIALMALRQTEQGPSGP